MLERQAMFKKLQELQMQKKLQELNDANQQNVTHYKHSSVLNYGVPVRDASQMFMFGDTDSVHGLPNRFVYSQAPMGHLPHFQTPVLSQGQTIKTQKVNNQVLDTLDPLKQKILLNVEGKSMENMFEKTDSKSAFKYGGLMQSSISEVSNGDSGSVLSFQNSELSNENQVSDMVESGKHQTQWLYNSSGISGFMVRSTVKKEDGDKWSTFEVKPGVGQQVTSSRRQPNTWVDVPMQQNPPSTSYAANRKIKLETGFGLGSGEMHPRGNHGPAVSPIETFGRSLKKTPVKYDSSIRAVVKKERVDKSQPVPSYATNLSVKPSIDQCGANEMALTRSSSIYLKQYDVAKKNMVVSKSKKRKVSTFEKLPWHYKEVTEDCSRLDDTRIAEVEWAHSVNRIPEKVTDSFSIVDRKRSRLILTTQLMQLLFRPSPKAVLSEDAIKHCDIITYHVAKFGLGDACSRASRSIGDNQDLLKVVEGFIDRSKRLEDMLPRFEKGESSILDVKVEFQDLDKFSVTNRFAKFHSRGPLVTSDTSASDGGSTMQKLNPQRYVTSSEMPSIVPEGQNCLLL